ncbi:MAG: response regulator [Magnetococcales bacterium]|nr:response regulator [Magnetococcales bacterium]
MINKQLHFFLVDDDPSILEIETILLESEGYRVSSTSSSVEALGKILSAKPDCVILDLMMPGVDGFEVCQQLRKSSGMQDVKIVFVSSKAFEHDRKRAIEVGGDGFILKPIDHETFVEKIIKIIQDRMELTYWGVRGTLPMSGEETLKYGGHTSCVTIEFQKGDFFIFDAGSGIKSLSNHLLSQKKARIDTKIFISHPHWDHINALPFFVPLYVPGHEIEILGASHGELKMRQLISSQMEGVYFPIQIKEFAARVFFRDLNEESFEINGIKIQTLLLNHPGNCLGYRVEHQGKSICYVTDNELPLETSQYFNQQNLDRLIKFIHGTDILITDTTYTNEEYQKGKELWGHSSVEQVAKLAHQAEVKALHLFHHDPDQTDLDIDAKHEIAESVLKMLDSPVQCVAPKERQSFEV